MQRVTARVAGRVQGVGFRYFVIREASARGVTGWVRNRADGSVELLAEGPRAALDELIEALRRGPPAARVTSVETNWLEGGPEHRGFQMRDGA